MSLPSRQPDLRKPSEYPNINMMGRFAAGIHAGRLTYDFALLRRNRTTANGVVVRCQGLGADAPSEAVA